MRRIEKTFETLKAKNKTALVSFIMGGDPDISASLTVMKELPKNGVDLIEIGMPFSDPVADGPVIQLAGQRAIASGTNIAAILKMVAEFRKEDESTPVILMGYANPVYSYGIDKFALDCADSGVDGVIIVDLPPEEDKQVREAIGNQFLDMIRLVTPTTDEQRLETILDGASGFLYYVSITGITGAAKADMDSIRGHLQQIKEKTNLPLAIGFGIKTPNDAQDMSTLGDAIVVGSSIVEKIANIEVKAGGYASDDSKINAVLDHVRSLSEALEAKTGS